MNFVIIGAGPAGVIAAESLRKLASDASITVLNAESEQPYSRMALPYFLAQDVGEGGTHLRHGDNHFESLDIAVTNARVKSVDATQRSVSTEEGNQYAYDRLLVASGSHTVRPPISGMDLDAIENCWTLADARRIAQKATPGSSVVLMGAGFIGCIVLEALAARKVDLTVIEMADRMLPRMMDETGGQIIKNWCEQRGVRVLTDTAVTEINEASKGVSLGLADGSQLDADLVVCATGVRPNVDFLADTGVAIDVGVLVDHHLATNVDGIFAAGDVAQGPDLSTGENAVHAIQPTASEHGRIAARNMAGATTPYRGSLSMNVLNTLGLVSSSFGVWDGVAGGEQSIAVDMDSSRYLRLEFDDDKLVGALALGLTQHVGVIRGLMQGGIPLGVWKSRLLQNPHRVMEAYLEQTQGVTPTRL